MPTIKGPAIISATGADAVPQVAELAQTGEYDFTGIFTDKPYFLVGFHVSNISYESFFVYVGPRSEFEQVDIFGTYLSTSDLNAGAANGWTRSGSIYYSQLYNDGNQRAELTSGNYVLSV